MYIYIYTDIHTHKNTRINKYIYIYMFIYTYAELVRGSLPQANLNDNKRNIPATHLPTNASGARTQSSCSIKAARSLQKKNKQSNGWIGLKVLCAPK